MQRIIGGLALLSIVTFALSLMLLPYLIRRIPSDYFLTLSEEKPKLRDYNVKILLLMLVKNIFGMLLFASGVAMLFLPGQGLITIFISLLLMNFPGKTRLIAFLTSQKKVRISINWIRAKTGKEPIRWPPD